MRLLGVSLVVALACGCDQSAFELPPLGEDPPPGPGSPAWDDTDLSCSSATDCAPGEMCDQGSCRPKQCDDGPYESAQPLGPRHVMFRDQELMVVDGNANQGAFWVDGYGTSGAIDYAGPGGGSYRIGTGALTDVARIETPEGAGMVVASAGSSTVTITSSAFAAHTVDTGVVPVAVGAGDVDGDEVDDVVAMSADGKIAVCSGTSCQRYNFGNGTTGVDLAVADVDGDGLAEVVFLLRNGDSTTVSVWNVDDGTVVGAGFDTKFNAVTAGDFDHDGLAEVGLLEDRGWFGFASDRVHLYRIGASFTGIAAIDTLGKAIDIGAGDIDGSDSDVLAVLGSDRTVDVLRWSGTSLTSTFRGSVGTTSSPTRIALGDLDGDSVSASLVEGPELVPGKLVPTVVVTFPPYDSAASGSGLPAVGVGNRTSVSTDSTETVSLNAGVEVGVDADFIGLFKAKLSTKLSVEVSRSHSIGQNQSVGTRFSLRPQTSLYGDQYAAVVVGCNCFHTYTYELVDPANKAGGSGHTFKLIVPVGGQTTVLSTPRYGALAAKLGNLPAVSVKTRIGDPKSYPHAPIKLDGSPVRADEQVFPDHPTLRVSDVGTVGFSLSVGETETNSAAMRTSVSVSGSVSALGASVGGSLGAGWGTSYSVTIGQTAEFLGEVPPLPDDPNTQEDEYTTRAFSFSPYVYRQPYTDSVSGETSGFYVLDYTVSQ